MEEKRQVTIDSLGSDREALDVLAALAEEQGYTVRVETVQRLVVEGPASASRSLKALAKLATMDGMDAMTRAVVGSVREEQLEIDQPKAPGTVNKLDFTKFALDHKQYDPRRMKRAASRAWTLVCSLKNNPRYMDILVFSGPNVEPSPFNVPGWRMPRDVDFESLAAFMAQAEIDIASGHAAEYGLSSNRGISLAGQTMAFLQLYIAETKEQLATQRISTDQA